MITTLQQHLPNTVTAVATAHMYRTVPHLTALPRKHISFQRRTVSAELHMNLLIITASWLLGWLVASLVRDSAMCWPDGWLGGMPTPTHHFQCHQYCIIYPLQPGGHYMYRQFNIQQFSFCPHSVFMCFVWISEQTAIISLYSIN